jgi:TRAP-type transport system periplasmic protein
MIARRPSRGRFVRTAAAISAGVGFGMPLLASGETLLRVSFPTPAAEPSSAECAKFARLAEQKSNGSLKLEIYFNGELSKSADVLAGIQSGVIDLALNDTSWLESRFNRLQALNLPFMFPSRPHLWRVLDGEIGRGIAEDMARQGVLALAWGAFSGRQFELRDKRVVIPEDLHGLRMRVIESPLSISMIAALGAIPVSIASTETYLALQQKVVDGLDVSVAFILASKMDAVIKYVSVTDHNFSPAPLMMSKRRFESLSADQKKSILAAAREFLPGWRLLLDNKSNEAIQEYTKRGGTVVNADKEAFRHAMAPVYGQFRVKLGADYINKMVKLATS